MYIRLHKRIIGLFLILIIFVTTMFYSQYNNLLVHLEESKQCVAELEDKIEYNKLVMQEKDRELDEALKVQEEITEAQSRIDEAPIFKVTAYDLSVTSCNKKKSDRGYGVTRNGTSVKGLQWNNARVIAADPKVLPMNSLVYIKFTDDRYSEYSGVFLVADTGSKILGKHIDFYLGDFNSEKAASDALDFGVTKAKVIVLSNLQSIK